MVRFEEKDHKYFNREGIEYTSVTKVIGKVKPALDTEFWSLYKALEALLVKDEFNKVKGKLVKSKSKKVLLDVCGKRGVSLEDLKRERKKVLQSWDKKKNDATTLGTFFHDTMEDITRKQFDFNHTWEYTDLKGFLNPGKEYPEVLIYNDKYKIAGQTDRVVCNRDGSLTIRDYKTNKKIEMVSYYNRKEKEYAVLKSPLEHIMDCNFYHYILQLSTYAWMLEQFGYKIKDLYIDFISSEKLTEEYITEKAKEPNIKPDDFIETVYPVPYLKTDVLKMLALL